MYHSHSTRRKWFITGLIATMMMGIGLRPTPALGGGDPIVACKTAMASAAGSFEATKLALLQKCELLKQAGTKPAGTDCHVDQATGIAKAAATAKATINKVCGSVALSNTGFTNLVKRCSAGDRWGGPCGLESECPGICVGGAKDTQSCSFTSSCNNRTCTKASCLGTADPDKINTNCTSDADCFDDHVAHALGVCPFGYECGQPGGPGLCAAGPLASKVCTGDSDCNKTAAAGDCNAGTCKPTSPMPGALCTVDADCNYVAPADTCDAGCGANTNVSDCKAGYCDQAVCASNKDCGICNPVGGVNPPNFNEPCSTTADCGKVCPAAAIAHANLPCKANSDCGGSVCGGDSQNFCVPGTCTAGFCAPADLNGHARATTGLCQPVDRCPNFENNKEPGVLTCDGGAHNGQVCTGDGTCPGIATGTKECNNTFIDCTTDADCGTGACVDRCQSGCGFPINNATAAADIGSCLTCIGEAAVDQIDSTVFGELKPKAKVCIGGNTPGQTCTTAADCVGTGPNKNGKCAAMDAAVDKCKLLLGAASSSFFQAKRAILQGCETRVITGRSAGPCPDASATTVIAKLKTGFMATVAKGCGGRDGKFESDPNALAGALDIKPDQASGLFTCPNLPGPAECAGVAGQPINTAEDLAKCLECVVEYKVDCLDRMATPALGPLPTFCNPTCGNGKIDGNCTGGSNAGGACLSSLDCPGGICTPIETCDDSNSVSGDTCPATCNVNTCAPSGQTRTAIVTVSAPVGTDLEGLSLFVTYPDGVVGIPGQSNDQSVLDRVIAGSGGGLLSANDLNYAVRLSNAGSSIPPVAFAVTMDTCTGASPASSSDFRCSVESASDGNGGALTDVTCHVTIL